MHKFGRNRGKCINLAEIEGKFINVVEIGRKLKMFVEIGEYAIGAIHL